MSTNPTPTTVRLPRRVIAWLEGTHLFQAPQDLDRHGYGQGGWDLVAAYAAAPYCRAGETITIGPDAVQVLRRLMLTLLAGADDEPSDPGNRADGKAARKILDTIGREG